MALEHYLELVPILNKVFDLPSAHREEVAQEVEDADRSAHAPRSRPRPAGH